jgi:four helix bundle protein
MSRGLIQNHEELDVYQLSMKGAMEIFEVSKQFPKEERYSLTDQVRRSSRSVCANLAEAWRRRQYEAAFVAKLSDSEAEAAETLTWLDFAVRCSYLESSKGLELRQMYNQILGMLVRMRKQAKNWRLPR